MKSVFSYCPTVALLAKVAWLRLLCWCLWMRVTEAWVPFSDPAAGMMTGANPYGGHPFADPGAGAAGPGEFGLAGAASNPFGNFLPNYNAYRGGSSGAIGSICYCDVRINKMGAPGELLFKLHYPTINGQNCQAAIQQCNNACRSQAQRQLTGNVLFEEGGLENVVPEKEVSVGTVLCKEHNKVIAPPGVIASVFAKPDACGRATAMYDLTGEETRLCCTHIAHPYIRTEHILVFSPECIAGAAAPAAATTAAPAANAAAGGANGAVQANPMMNSGGMGVPAQAPEPVPYNQAPSMAMQLPHFRHYAHAAAAAAVDPMNAMMLNAAFG
ncbi:uncharacterized protein LOC129587585 [Paramacrobiotus metropolitanus]|uniref:uncharacterized protein LOC129587585 n=1 Tax=Paramacrobiotus metropolitanus TaxID=2943436 RepID=UPI0024461693|nr:uncharacterized protein LOC129587585 [Paramacrobiotus metropolitanus]XP_055337369.1 uncharacterized protein LOC129587585 [Paramacrobiotus metropolitanus]